MKIDLNEYEQDDQDRYNRIKELTKDDLSRISPKWAFGKNHLKCTDPKFFPDSDYVIIQLNLPKLISSTNFIELNPNKLITDDINDFRYVEIIERWKIGLFIDPPIISLANNEEKIRIIDGRHRTIAAYLTGAEMIPVAVHKSFNIERLEHLK
ncbi:ParB-like nuclease family protein [Nonlabens dokdonensis]|jgi:hypothetical protein|uniref:Uncharacterized protein n=2 Tax=Nonlabens dokdonensis TaxID=328515 RepID=L7WE22_NONDD|nr:ParB N-terminal domain-containing protein [Nonlabens dokdonensis]AGC78324.1 hypothetical protein DDD_3197 [Nonlabens dokdonensis DSW-6]PZX37791.1 ParB-like nuclease family protein [Nonlabens dokdonensis]